MLFDIFDRLLSRVHIQSISFTFFVYFEPEAIQCGLPLLLFVPFLFYKVNLILLQKYLHVTTVRVGI